MTKPKNICGARKRGGDKKGEPCQRPAGWGTDHPGTGRCKLHGGSLKGAPRGNKYALKTGVEETIWYNVLSEEEREFWDSMNLDRLEQLKQSLKISTVRVYRIMKRIHELEKESDLLLDNTESGITDKGPIQIERHEHKDNRIIKLEEALTRAQAQHTRSIEAMTKIIDKAKEQEDMGHLDSLILAIEESQKMIADAKEKHNEQEEG